VLCSYTGYHVSTAIALHLCQTHKSVLLRKISSFQCKTVLNDQRGNELLYISGMQMKGRETYRTLTIKNLLKKRYLVNKFETNNM
jgi:hypothetical protein